jgi:ADP-ribose pyrophosphatase YjhB (NUDIX family)
VTLTPEDLAARYDDVYRKSDGIELDPDRFESARDNETGWGAGALVTDHRDRVLLVREDDAWFLPGGIVEPGESPAETAVREVREETGVEVAVRTLAAIAEQTFVHADTGESFEFHFATFWADPVTTTTDDDPGLEDETIHEAVWTGTLPENTFDRDLVARLLDDEV